jgi:hypothetical protein
MPVRPTTAARSCRPSRGTLGLFLVTFAFLLTTFARLPVAAAQCGAKPSTCAQCHDGSRASYAADAPWHVDHCFASVCAVCHGGVPDAPAAADAHVGLVPPLGADAGQCASCHGAASATLAQRYASAAALAHADAGADAGAPAGHRPLPPRADLKSNDKPAAIVAALLAALGLGWVLARERGALRRWRESWMRKTATSPPDERS